VGSLVEIAFSGGLGGHIVAGALSIARLLPIFFLVPYLGGKNVPAPAKLGLVLSFALILSPTTSAEVAAEAALLSTVDLVLLAIKEALVGTVIAFLAALVFYAVQMGGSLIDTVRGQTMATALSPTLPERSSHTSAFTVFLLIVVFLAIDGHHLLIRALAESFEMIPITRFPAIAGTINAMFFAVVRLTGEFFVIGLAFALPVLATVLLVDLALGIINRTAPEIHLFFLGMPVKAMVGIIVLLIALSTIVDMLIGNLNENNRWIRWLIHRVEGA
jgi:flagellar biosynthetic protein FliR